MDAARNEGSSVQGYVILGVLLAVAAVSWAVLAWHPPGAGMDMTSVTMGLSLAAFLVIWVVMMVAMMFPTAAPMILTFHKIQRRRASGGFVDTAVFVAGYLMLWALTGIVAYALARGAEGAAGHFTVSASSAARVGGVILILAGLYQFTPLKTLCLTQCRTPLAFIMTSWRSGRMGALAMGWRHGLYCFGCCWLLFAILFPLGMMNLAAMAAITVLILGEKSLPWGRWLARASAAVLIAYGGAVLVSPRLLPTFSVAPSMSMGGMNMGTDMPGMSMKPSGSR